MTQAGGTLASVWPYADVSVPADVGAFPVSHFTEAGETEASLWYSAQVAEGAPRSAYAVRLQFDAAGLAVSAWDEEGARWGRAVSYPTAMAAPNDDQVCMLELKSVVNGSVQTEADLAARMRFLLRGGRRRLAVLRFGSRALGILSIIILFAAIRLGVETGAVEVFGTVFLLAAATGALAVGMRETGRSVAAKASLRLEKQARSEAALRKVAAVTVGEVRDQARTMDVGQQDQAALFGFLLLCLLVYFVSPLVVLGVMIGLITSTLLLLGVGDHREMLFARTRAVRRLENALLSWRATLDHWAPARLRRAKILVLRAGIGRYQTVETEFRAYQARAGLRLSAAQACSFVCVFAAYALSSLLDDGVSASAIGDTLSATSLFSVAPIIVLISASKATATVAQILVRNFPMLRSGRS